MNTLAQNKTSEFDTAGLKSLLNTFLRDPFVRTQNLEQLTLEEIGRFFEEHGEDIQNDVAGFERVKGHYCLILMELELLSYTTVPEESLVDFIKKLGPDETSKIIAPITLPDLPFSFPNIALDDIVLPGGAKLETSGTRNPTWNSALTSFQSASGRAYYELGRTMGFPGSFPRSIRSEDLERLHCQCQIWSVECELHKRLSNSLSSFWPQRDTHISRIIFQNGHAYDFHPSLKEGLEDFAKNHPNWLYEKRFPVAGLMSSLRYILSVPSIDKFIPASIDFACLLMLFGRDAAYGPQLIYNVLGIQGISNDEILEITARLCRAQRLKAKILNPHQQLTPEIVEIVNRDTSSLIQLATKLEARQFKKEVA